MWGGVQKQSFWSKRGVLSLKVRAYKDGFKSLRKSGLLTFMIQGKRLTYVVQKFCLQGKKLKVLRTPCPCRLPVQPAVRQSLWRILGQRLQAFYGECGHQV